MHQEFRDQPQHRRERQGHAAARGQRQGEPRHVPRERTDWGLLERHIIRHLQPLAVEEPAAGV